jgi:hypothetical protein
MRNAEVLVCVTNHDCSDNARRLRRQLGGFFETIVIDSGSTDNGSEFDVELGNVFYPGLFNESVRQCRLRGRRFLYFIAADVQVDSAPAIHRIIRSLDDDVGIWAPSTRGQAHDHCRNKQSGHMRDAPYAEGYTYVVDVDLCDIVYPVDRASNTFGYGIDLLLGFNCVRNHRRRCVIDDRVEVHHREGKGYDPDAALEEMYAWAVTARFGPEVERYFRFYREIGGHEKSAELLAFLRADQGFS